MSVNGLPQSREQEDEAASCSLSFLLLKRKLFTPQKSVHAFCNIFE